MQISRYNFEPLFGAEPRKAGLVLDLPDAPPEEEALPPPQPTYSEDDLKHAKNEAYDAGFQAGKVEGKREMDHEHHLFMQAVGEQVKIIQEQILSMQKWHREHVTAQYGNVGQLVITAAQKLALEALRKDPLADIEQMVQDCLAILMSQPDIVIAINPRFKTAMQERFGAVAKIAGDDDLPPGDCKVQWANGVANRSIDAIWLEIEQVITRAFSKPPIIEAELTPTEPPSTDSGDTHG
jgi:flagellar assembly protein FliH